MQRTSRILLLRCAGATWIVVAMAALTGCPLSPGTLCQCAPTAYDPEIAPANFVDEVDNPYFPLTPGTTYVYEAETDDGTEHIEVEVTDATVEILGVTCTVVHDTVTLDEEIIEDTFDWYAQDVEGNVWYFGEASMEFENGIVRSTFGSWEAGVHCAKPGIVMLADPDVADTYRQEFYPCVAEGMATVNALDETIMVPHGTFNACLRTQ